MAGKKFLNGVPYSLHMTFDGLNDVVTNEHQEIAAEICLRHGGTEMVIPSPRYFGLSRLAGSNRPSGLGRGAVASCARFLPALKGGEAGATTERFFEENRELMEKHNIRTSYLTCFSRPSSLSSPFLLAR